MTPLEVAKAKLAKIEADVMQLRRWIEDGESQIARYRVELSKLTSGNDSPLNMARKACTDAKRTADDEERDSVVWRDRSRTADYVVARTTSDRIWIRPRGQAHPLLEYTKSGVPVAGMLSQAIDVELTFRARD